MSMRLGAEGSSPKETDVRKEDLPVGPSGAMASVSDKELAKKVSFAALHVITDMEPMDFTVSDFRHKLSVSDYTSTPGVKRLVEDVLAKPSLEAHCLERGIGEQEITELALSKYSGDRELAAAAFIKQNIDRWSVIESTLGPSVGLEAIHADTLAHQALCSPGVVKDDRTGVSFIHSEGKIFIMDAKALGVGSYKTAIKVVEYFTGAQTILLQASDTPIVDVKPKVSMSPQNAQKALYERLAAAGDALEFNPDGAPSTFLADLVELVSEGPSTESQASSESEEDVAGASAGHPAGATIATGEHPTGASAGHPAGPGSLASSDSGAVDSGSVVYGAGAVFGVSVKHDDVALGTVEYGVASGSVVERPRDVPRIPDFMRMMEAAGGIKTLGVAVDSSLVDWRREIELYRELASVPHTAKLHSVIEVGAILIQEC